MSDEHVPMGRKDRALQVAVKALSALSLEAHHYHNTGLGGSLLMAAIERANEALLNPVCTQALRAANSWEVGPWTE